jgi:hypothetical protein
MVAVPTPTGWPSSRSAGPGLCDFIDGYVAAGLSKFVVRRFAPSCHGPKRPHGLGDAILGLQT